MASRYTPIVPSAAALATLATVLALAPGAAPSGARPPGRLAVVGDGTLYVIQASDGRKRIVYPLAVSSAAWSRDGRLAYVADGAVRAGDRWSRVVASLGARFSVGVSWAPDGRRLVYAFHPAVAATARLVVARRDGGRPRIIDTRVSAYQVPQWSPRGNAIAYFRPSAHAG